MFTEGDLNFPLYETQFSIKQFLDVENTHFIVLSTCCCTFQSVSSVCLSQRQHGSYCHIPMYINSYVKPTVRLWPGPSFLSHHKCSSSLMAARGGRMGGRGSLGLICTYYYILNG